MVYERDLDLLQHWSQGDNQAGIELLNYYKGFIYKTCSRFGITSENDFREVYQNLWVFLLERRTELPSLVWKSFAGFLGWRLRKAIEDHWKIKRSESGDLGDPPAPDQVAAIENLEVIDKCRNKLPPMEKRIFDLRYFQEMTNKEIAGLLERTAKAVAQRVCQLCKRMQKCLNRLL